MLQKEILNALTTCPLIGKVVTIRYPFEKDEKSISIKRENVEVFDCHLSRVTRGSGNRRSILYPYKNEQCYDKGGWICRFSQRSLVEARKRRCFVTEDKRVKSVLKVVGYSTISWFHFFISWICHHVRGILLWRFSFLWKTQYFILSVLIGELYAVFRFMFM